MIQKHRLRLMCLNWTIQGQSCKLYLATFEPKIKGSWSNTELKITKHRFRIDFVIKNIYSGWFVRGSFDVGRVMGMLSLGQSRWLAVLGNNKNLRIFWCCWRGNCCWWCCCEFRCCSDCCGWSHCCLGFNCCLISNQNILG